MKTKTESISIVIPAWNESKTIKRVIFDAKRVVSKLTDNFEIIVIDDCSTDNTIEILRNLKISELRVYHHKSNKGIEPTLKELYGLARKNIIFFNGADGDISMNVINDLFVSMKEQNADLVVGNRKFKNYTLKRRIVSTLYNYLVWVLTGVRVYDAGTVKLVKSDKYKNLQIKSKSVFAEAERLVRSVYNGSKLVKVDIYQNSNERNDRVSVSQLYNCMRDLLALSIELKLK
jgi:glycosyltransferase involved in cell wall biosynthesis